MGNSFRYVLRYQIDPDFGASDRIAELVAFCVASRVEEVMLFTTPEELSPGHPTDDELTRYIELGKAARTALNRAQIAMSLNPWTTTYHVSRGRRLRAGQNFRRMIGENGQSCPISACPLCENWQSWLCATFTRMAREIQPTVIWVEDDWRLHNHGVELGWGGCFCDAHLARFGRSIEREVTREEVVEHVLANGPPHPWRKIWLELWRDTLLEPARRLRDAMRSAAPTTRLGLMSSTPDVHSAEGRDWHALQDALGDEPAFITRPHMPPYTATRAISTPPTITRHTIANLKRPLEIFPELENSPRCGQYSKSHTYSAWECFHAAAFGSHGITINHYDMMGNGISLDSTFGQMLKKNKLRLDAIAQLGIDDNNAQGVRMLFRPDVAQHIQATGSPTFHSLTNPSDVWSHACYVLGISHGFTSTILPELRHIPTAVSGQTLRALSDDDIRTLLSGVVLLDGCSAEILVERGFGERIGLECVEWRTLEVDGYAYESIIEPDPSRFGIAHPRMTAQRCALRMLAMRAVHQNDIRTWIRRADHQALFPGLIVHRNAADGCIATLAYPFDGGHQFFMGYFNVFRRQLMQELLFEMAPRAPMAAVSSHPMHLYRVPATGGTVLVLMNPLHDVAEHPTVMLRPALQHDQEIRILMPDGTWDRCAVEVQTNHSCSRLKLPISVAALETCVLLITDRSD